MLYGPEEHVQVVCVRIEVERERFVHLNGLIIERVEQIFFVEFDLSRFSKVDVSSIHR